MIGINGMGRIGRNFFRVLLSENRLEDLTAINDVMPKKHLVYLLQYDTVRGRLPAQIVLTDDGIAINDHEIYVFHQKEPKNIPWAAARVKIAVEATGAFTEKAALRGHIAGGATYCILTTTGSEDIPLYVMGVNQEDFDGQNKIFSVGSCTVNGSAPLLKVLSIYHPSTVYLNEIHAYSARQQILDSFYPEIRRCRASADNIIPLNINLDLSLMRLFPQLKSKIKSITSRVPVPCGVLSDMTVVFEQPPANDLEMKNY
ncbi:MAG: glyceraldehyde 3-phosphate dehydrogenase NAD-binding domain-containing protein, partial [Fulvivirga sp.]|nr:glyceraldehyde 3-phosphate dehydrogenase NAD-binding domain-containing protein [Fulvivirga sp.]